MTDTRKCRLISTTPNMDGTFDGVFEEIETGELITAKNCYPLSVEMPEASSVHKEGEELFMHVTFTYGNVPTPSNVPTVPKPLTESLQKVLQDGKFKVSFPDGKKDG